MTKMEFSIFFVAYLISAACIGAAIGVHFTRVLKWQDSNMYYYFFSPGLLLWIINFAIFGRKYGELRKSLK